MKIPREWLLLLGSLLVIAALYNHYMGHSAYLVEIVLIATGTAIATYTLRTGPGAIKRVEDGLLVKVLSRYIAKERCVVLLPLVGFLIILVWTIWKLFVVGESNLRMNDFIVTLFGLSLVLYYQGPSRYTLQKDFAVLYLMFLAIVFVVIWGTYTVVTGESYYRVTAYSEYYLITIPVVKLVNLFGTAARAELDLDGLGLSNMIDYEYQGRLLRVGIGTGCSGLYSAGMFFSAFIAFVLVRYRKIDRRILVALALGLFMTWAANIVRMAITIMVGSAYGHPALAFVHSYLGILIFVACVTVFWYLMVGWLDRDEEAFEPPLPVPDRSGLQE
ncbi:MAG: exosortase/archaeosortase family protein [Thermoplasmata archaeon]